MRATVNDLVGKTINKIIRIDEDDQGDELFFMLNADEGFRMFHYQDCCETVYLEDIEGDLSDLIGNPILYANEETNSKETNYGSMTWTFYRIGTIKGGVVLVWRGESNGYYSESVDFIRVQHAPSR